MKINPWKWLTYRTDFTADGNIDNYQYFLPQYELGYSKNPYPTNEHSKNYGLYWGWKNVVTMEKTFKRKHKTSLMLGHEMTSRSSDYLQGKRTHGDNLLTDLDAGDAAYATYKTTLSCRDSSRHKYPSENLQNRGFPTTSRKTNGK